MTYLFFDTETTGLPDMRRSAGFPGQPRICQLGAIVTDADGRIKAEANLIVKPDGWSIPPEASKIHGIGQDDAMAYGLSIKGVLSIFDRLLGMCRTVIAHNIQFDLFMLQIEAERAQMGIDLPGNHCCTMADSIDVLRLPPTPKMVAAGMDKFKSPNLQEAYRHFFGRDFDGAHDAMADVRACKEVFFALKQMKAAA